MPIFKGNTSGSATSLAYNNSLRIKSFIITNKSAGSVTVNASILDGSTNIWITPLNAPLTAGQAWQDDDEKLLYSGMKIYILVSGNCDYFFTLENI